MCYATILTTYNDIIDAKAMMLLQTHKTDFIMNWMEQTNDPVPLYTILGYDNDISDCQVSGFLEVM